MHRQQATYVRCRISRTARNKTRQKHTKHKDKIICRLCTWGTRLLLRCVTESKASKLSLTSLFSFFQPLPTHWRKIKISLRGTFSPFRAESVSKKPPFSYRYFVIIFLTSHNYYWRKILTSHRRHVGITSPNLSISPSLHFVLYCLVLPHTTTRRPWTCMTWIC